MGLVVLALIGLFGVMPYTYRTLQDDSLRAEASTAAQCYLDDLRLAVQSGKPVPSPTSVPIALGDSFVTGERNTATATVDLAATCAQPNGAVSSLYDCIVTIDLKAGTETRSLAPLETYVVRQLP